VRVFITGATGFVGAHVARSYAAEGAVLRLLTRKSSRLDGLAGLDAETVVGDLRDPASLRSAIEGCDTLVHVAADYRLWVRDPQEMYAANVDGTRIVMVNEPAPTAERRIWMLRLDPTTGQLMLDRHFRDAGSDRHQPVTRKR